MRTRTFARPFLLLSLALAVALAAAACGASAPDPDIATETPIVATQGSSDGAGEADDANANANVAEEPTAGSVAGGDSVAAGLPADIPVLANPEKLKVTADMSYVSYEANNTLAEATTFYQEQLLVSGWEQKNKKDSGFGDSITILREKPAEKAKISVTIQTVAGQDRRVRVLITLIK